MLKRGRKNADWSYLFFRCGDPVTVLTKTGAFWRKEDCDRWDCDLCRKRKIKEYQEKVTEQFPGAIVCIGEAKMKGRALSRFLSRSIPKPYFAVRLDDHSVIIANKRFDRSKLRNKKKFVDNVLPEILNTIRSGRVVSLSRKENIMNKNKVEHVSPYYGKIPGDRVEEWKRLLNDKERAYWLRRQPGIRLFKAGKTLLEENP
jgi:hypothetical protein